MSAGILTYLILIDAFPFAACEKWLWNSMAIIGSQQRVLLPNIPELFRRHGIPS